MSDLSSAIVRARRQIETREAPIRRQLAAAYRRAIDELDADLAAVTRMIRDARASGVEVSPDWLRRQGRYRTLIVQAETQFARFSRDGLRILHEGQLRAVSGGAADAVTFMQAAGVTALPAFGANINTPAVERVLSVLSGDSPLRGVLDRYGDNAARVIEERLVQGIIQGTGPREVTRQIRRELGSGLNRARLDALVRTTMMDGFRGSLFDSYAAMGLERWVWTASHGSRVCLACLSRSGTVFPMTTPFMATHTRCRCSPTPYSENVTLETGPQWFARQSPEIQRAMMPSGESYAAFQRGDIALKDFVGHRRSKVWGNSITQLSGREALRRAG